ncbi:MAG: four helix bundle protein [Bacteroidales bacterium]|jgi:four helix bundle protein
MKENIIVIKTFNFSLDILQLYKLLANQREYIISKQLLRSATSIGANVEEAGAASSRKDFALKMSIASKEAREAKYWLRLLKEDQFVKDYDFEKLITDVDDIINILTKIVKTTQQSIK